MRKRWLLAFLAILALPALVRTHGPAGEKIQDAGKSFEVPYRLTDAGHILVRAKVNGKGPFNFIVDTGAPLVYLDPPVAKKLGLVVDAKKSLTTLEELKLEGGVVHKQFACSVRTWYQLDALNGLGLSGVELHGVIGYTLLSNYRMEIDLTKDRMKWTRLDFTPPAPEGSHGRGIGDIALELVGKAAKAIGGLAGIKAEHDNGVRGFFGLDLAEKDNTVLVQTVTPNGPAAAAGLLAGDRIVTVDDLSVGRVAETKEILGTVPSGQPVRFEIRRANDTMTITVTPAEGL